MSRIKGKNTAPELRVRKFLHQNGFRFRLNDKAIPGKPDIVLKKYNLLIFIHGCFWHRHKGCKYCTTPKTNVAFWLHKFNATVTRDEKNIKNLEDRGWNILILWECEIRDTIKMVEKLSKVLEIE